MAAAAVALWRIQGKGLRRFSGGGGLAVLMLFCSVVTLAFWALGSWSSPLALGALYVWSGLVGTITAVQFWLALGERYTITQAKRLYRLIGAGSVLGAVAGAGLARVVSDRYGGGTLVLTAALLFAVTSAACVLLMRGRTRVESDSVAPAESGSMRHWAALLRGHPYVPRLAGLVLVSTVAL